MKGATLFLSGSRAIVMVGRSGLIGTSSLGKATLFSPEKISLYSTDRRSSSKIMPWRVRIWLALSMAIPSSLVAIDGSQPPDLVINGAAVAWQWILPSSCHCGWDEDEKCAALVSGSDPWEVVASVVMTDDVRVK